jgi:hypothetical protein
MSLKLKVLGMGLLAMIATSAFAVINAGATTPGHFVSSVHHTTIVGEENPGTPHTLHLEGDGLEGQIGCNNASYSGTASGTTIESLTITPSYANCLTTGTSTAVNVTTNGCTYTFTVTSAGGAARAPVHLFCPTSSGIEVHHPNCTITIKPQTVADAGEYTNKLDVNGRHYITLDVNATFNDEYHGGICIFLGTNHKGTLKGSATVRGFGAAGQQVDITAT